MYACTPQLPADTARVANASHSPWLVFRGHAVNPVDVGMGRNPSDLLRVRDINSVDQERDVQTLGRFRSLGFRTNSIASHGHPYRP